VSERWDAGTIRHWRLGLIGYGAVGHALGGLLRASATELAERHGISIAVGLLATRRGGVLVDSHGAPPGGGIVLDPGPGQPSGASAAIGSGLDIDVTAAFPTAPVDLIVEMTPLDRVEAEPATGHIRAALRHGLHVITANKGPLALHGPELRREAAAAGLALRYEATLMDCLPALALREAFVPLGSVESFAAIVNATSNFVLDAMAGGRSVEAAVAHAQQLGIAEADPSADLDGWDGAFKAAILAQLLLDRDVTAGDVERIGLDAVNPVELASADAAGERVRFVARGGRDGQAVRVAPERVPAASLFGTTNGFSMALAVETQYAGRLEMALVDPLVDQTAYAILMDLIAIDHAVRAVELRKPRGWTGD
jgi:homoserine dehydrogenase